MSYRLQLEWPKKWLHLFFAVLFFGACFYLGIWSYDNREKILTLFNNRPSGLTISEEVGLNEQYQLPDISQSIALKNFLENNLQPSIDTDNPKNKDSLYKQTRNTIITDYESGKRDLQTVQSFLYLNSLENNVSAYEQAAQEWCVKNESECLQTKNTVTFSGAIRDSKWKPIANAKIFLSGGEKATTQSDKDGGYKISFLTINPRRVRLVVQHPDFAGGAHTVVTLDPKLLGSTEQLFEKDFTLTEALQSIVLDTANKKVISGWAKSDKNGFTVENNFSKYFIPFDAIQTPDKKPYKGRVSVRVFEFDRNTANEFLASDVFDEIHGFASEWLITYSMPLIFFYDASWARLEVFREKPMTVWTTNRELKALIDEMSMRPGMPGFNPDDYEESSSPENIAKEIKEDELRAYEVSQKDPQSFPITHAWLLENFSRLPGFFVFDQSTGLWENTGYSLVHPSTDTQHSLMAHFWTKK